MNEKKLTIIDLENHSDIKIYNSNILFVNRGKINFENSSIIKFNINKDRILKKKFLINISDFFEKLKNKMELKYISSQELEIFNLRNDKITYFEKLCVFESLKKFNKKFKYFDLITDNEKYLKIYIQIFDKITTKFVKKKDHKSINSIKFGLLTFKSNVSLLMSLISIDQLFSLSFCSLANLIKPSKSFSFNELVLPMFLPTLS